MHRELRDALASIASRLPSSASIAAIGVPCPAVDPLRLLPTSGSKAPISAWLSPTLSLVGFGETVRLEASGPSRLVSMEEQARALFSRVHVEQLEADFQFPKPCLIGGLSFCNDTAPKGPWSAFADASFSLPRLLYGTDGERAWVWLCARVEELSAGTPPLAEELSAMLQAIESAAGSRADIAAETSTLQRDVLVEGTSQSAYCALVEAALAEIRGGALDKVVAVAASRFSRQSSVGARLILHRLSQGYPETMRFAVERGGRLFVGASPERLVSRRGLSVETDALAGTAKRCAEDAATQRALLESKKDRHEHALVVEAITNVIRRVASEIEAAEEPKIRSLRNVHHLWTPIRARLCEDTHVLRLVDALHPTPAVSGTPRDLATAWITAHEQTARGWYTGAVGWINALGDGEFAVAIRAGLVGPDDAWLYAGAGIVEGSDPLAEFAETRAKQVPMLAALGIVV